MLMQAVRILAACSSKHGCSPTRVLTRQLDQWDTGILTPWRPFVLTVTAKAALLNQDQGYVRNSLPEINMEPCKAYLSSLRMLPFQVQVSLKVAKCSSKKS